jgi:hypothetical protein
VYQHLLRDEREKESIMDGVVKRIPMLFNQDMVKALLEGRKVVTRRPVKQSTKDKDFGGILKPNEVAGEVNEGDYTNALVKPGDLIWVRETFRYFDAAEECACYETPCACPSTGTPLYKASHDDDESKWKPSIHMPRTASRLTLRVTKVSVDRVREISAEEAVKEGMPTEDEAQKMASDAGLGWYQKPVAWFKGVWERTYGTWVKNPFVWCIEFEVVNENVDKV